MKNQNYQAIVDGLDLLVSGKAVKSNGKINGVNLAKESNITKATLYRYFDAHPELRQDFDSARKNFNPLTANPPETLQEAFSLLKLEVKQLRLALAETKRNAEIQKKLNANQILILWTDNERLKGDLKRIQNKSSIVSNIKIAQ